MNHCHLLKITEGQSSGIQTSIKTLTIKCNWLITIFIMLGIKFGWHGMIDHMLSINFTYYNEETSAHYNHAFNLPQCNRRDAFKLQYSWSINFKVFVEVSLFTNIMYFECYIFWSREKSKCTLNATYYVVEKKSKFYHLFTALT